MTARTKNQKQTHEEPIFQATPQSSTSTPTPLHVPPTLAAMLHGGQDKRGEYQEGNNNDNGNNPNETEGMQGNQATYQTRMTWEQSPMLWPDI